MGFIVQVLNEQWVYSDGKLLSVQGKKPNQNMPLLRLLETLLNSLALLFLYDYFR